MGAVGAPRWAERQEGKRIWGKSILPNVQSGWSQTQQSSCQPGCRSDKCPRQAELYCLWPSGHFASLHAAEEWVEGGVGHHYAAGSCALRKTSLALNLNCPSVWHFNASKSFLHNEPAADSHLSALRRWAQLREKMQSCLDLDSGSCAGCSGLTRNMTFALQVLNFHTDFFLSNLPTPFCILFPPFYWIIGMILVNIPSVFLYCLGESEL